MLSYALVIPDVAYAKGVLYDVGSFATSFAFLHQLHFIMMSDPSWH
jgi:hypothetical protein